MSNAIKYVMVPIDGSMSSTRALDFATQLAADTGAVVEIVTVIDLGQLDFIQTLHLTDAQLDKWQSNVRTEVLESAAKHAAETEGVTVTTSMLHGGVIKSLLAHAEQEHISAVVIGRRGQNPLEAIFQGSVSAGLVRRCAKPVIVVP